MTQTMPLFVPLAETTGPPLTLPTDTGVLVMAIWLMDALLMLNTFIAWEAGERKEGCSSMPADQSNRESSR